METDVFKKMLQKMVESGKYLNGEMIPSERSLAQRYNINRMAVKKAMNQLATEGLLTRIHGKGTFIQNKDYDKLDLGYLNESGNSGITAMVKSQGVKISNRVLVRGKIKGNPFFENRLRLTSDEEIYALHRIRYGNEEIIGVEYTYLVAKYFTDIDEMNFKNISLYDYMDSRGHMPIVFNQRFRIMDVADKDQEHLRVPPKTPVYYFEFLGMDDGGEVVEYTESIMKTDKSSFRFAATATG